MRAGASAGAMGAGCGPGEIVAGVDFGFGPAHRLGGEVGAGDLTRSGRACEPWARGARDAPFVPGGEADRVAEGGELGEQAGRGRPGRRASLGGVEGDSRRGAGLRGWRRPARSAWSRGPTSRKVRMPIRAIASTCSTNRTGLASWLGQERPGCVGVGRIGPGGRVGEGPGAEAGANSTDAERLAERGRRRRRRRGGLWKAADDFEDPGRDPPAAEGLGGPGDLGGVGPERIGLAGGVAVGQDEVEPFLASITASIASIGAITASIPPRSPPDRPAIRRRGGGRGRRRRGPASIRPGGVERGQLAEAVAGEGVGPEAEGFEDPIGPRG